MLKLNKSQIDSLPFDFHKAVADFVAEKQQHRFRVQEPAPGAPHAWVELAVRRIPGEIGQPADKRKPAVPGTPDDYVADYEIVDDSPPPPTLEERKAAIAHQLQADAQAATDVIDPPLKRRLAALEYQHAIGLPEDQRNGAHKLRIRDSESVMQKVSAIVFHLATMEAELHDLTADQIDKWKPKPFPN